MDTRARPNTQSKATTRLKKRPKQSDLYKRHTRRRKQRPYKYKYKRKDLSQGGGPSITRGIVSSIGEQVQEYKAITSSPSGIKGKQEQEQEYKYNGRIGSKTKDKTQAR